MKHLTIDCISTQPETSGIMLNTSVVSLLDNEEIIRIFASNRSLYLFTEQIKGDEKIYYVIADSLRSIPYDEVANRKLSDDGKVMLFLYRTGNEWFINGKNKVEGPYDEVKDCYFSFDGSINVYKAKMNGIWKLYLRHGKEEKLQNPALTGLLQYRSSPFLFTYSCSYDCFNGIVNNKPQGYVITEKATYGPYLKVSVLYYNEGQSAAAVIYDKTDKEYFLLYDDIIEGPFLNDNSNMFSQGPSITSDLFIHTPSIAPEDKSNCFHFTAMTDKGYFIYTDHEKAGPFEEIISITYSIAGRSFYAEVKKHDENNQTAANINSIFSRRNSRLRNINESYRSIWVLIDNEELGPYDDVSGPFLNPINGDICFFAAKDDTTYLYDVNGIISGPYTSIQSLYFNRGLELLSYHAEIDRQWYYVRNVFCSEPFESIGFLPNYDRDTGIDIFTAEIGGMHYVIIGDKKSGPYDEVAAIGKKLYNGTYRYIARVKKRWYLFKEDITLRIDLIPGKILFNCDDTVICISPFDSQQSDNNLFYIICDDHLDGPFGPFGTFNEHKTDEGIISGYSTLSYNRSDKSTKYSLISGNNVFGPYENSPYRGSLHDGSIVAAVHLNGNIFLIAGDKSYGPYKEISKFVFSKSNKRFACSVTKDDGHYIFCDGIEYGPFENTRSIKLMSATDEFLFTYSVTAKIESILLRGRNYGPFGIMPESDIIQSSDGKMISFSSWENNKLDNYIIKNEELIHGILNIDGSTAYVLREMEVSHDDKNQ